MDRIIVDGQVIELDEWHAVQALKNLTNAPSGGVLVAVSSGGQVLVRWIDVASSKRIVPSEFDAKKSARRVKPSKKLCPWLFTEVESYFDQVAIEQSDSLETIHANFNDSLEQHGKHPESFRRWVSKIRKRWVKTVVANGKRLDDIESLVSYPT
jgi:hypothetical protein